MKYYGDPIVAAQRSNKDDVSGCGAADAGADSADIRSKEAGGIKFTAASSHAVGRLSKACERARYPGKN